MSTNKTNFQAFNEKETLELVNQAKQQWPLLSDSDALKQRAEFYKKLLEMKPV